MPKANKKKKSSINKRKGELKSKPKRRLKPQEFMDVMARIKIIDKEIKAETKLYDIKIQSLDLEKEYLWNKIEPK